MADVAHPDGGATSQTAMTPTHNMLTPMNTYHHHAATPCSTTMGDKHHHQHLPQVHMDNDPPTDNDTLPTTMMPQPWTHERQAPQAAMTPHPHEHPPPCSNHHTKMMTGNERHHQHIPQAHTDNAPLTDKDNAPPPDDNDPP